MHVSKADCVRRSARVPSAKEVRVVIARLTAFSRPIVILAALALLMDLVLTWRDAPVSTQYLTLSGGSSALHGWGVLAAGLLIAFVLAELVVPKFRKVLLGVAVAASAATVLAFFTGSAAVVKIDGDTIAAVEATLWPAYLGLVLAGILVVASVRVLVEPPKQRLPLPPFRTEWKADGS
jgi:hypothetical protein